MKRFLLVFVMMTAIYFCIANDQMSPVDNHKQGINIPAKNLQLPTPNRTIYNFVTPPISLLSSFWDYQIGGYTSTAVRVQSASAGNGVYLSYMGQRTASGQRRVFYAYLNHVGEVVVNNEITSNQIREGYVTHDVDRLTGKPIFAWHSNIDDTDTQLEVSTAWDAFLEGIPGLISEPTIAINNPIPLTINNVAYNDNEFIWPIVEIGPSPVPNMRRVYVFNGNSVAHSNPANASENSYYAFADFDGTLLETGGTLSWTYATVPLLNDWNTDQTAWRRFFHANVVGEDGKVFMIGYHVGEDAATLPIVEPYLDVLVNTNYGEGAWTKYSINPDRTVPNPDNFFTDTNNAPYPFLRYAVIEGTNNNGYVTSDGHLHYPLLFGFTTPDSASYFPLLQYLKDVDFNVADHSFLIHDLYPTGNLPNDGNPVLPWDIDDDADIDTTATGDVALTPTWPFVYWDQAAYATVLFDYNTVKFTKANDQGMVACVWSSSLFAKLYNGSPADYPELAPYSGIPEIMISVYPVTGPNGPQWSEPIDLNAVDTPQLAPGGDPMIPEWVYPGDYVEYMGVTAEGYKVGKLHLMFFDDNTWGSGSIANPIGQNDGGRVTYAAMEIAWSPGAPIAGPIVAVSDETATLPAVLLQNYPNPFNPSTTIEYNINKSGKVELTIYNIKGQTVRSLVNEIKSTGDYKVTWDGLSNNGNKVGSGVYFYRLDSNGKSITKKMVMLK